MTNPFEIVVYIPKQQKQKGGPMTKEQILGLRLIELEKVVEVRHSLLILEGVANDKHEEREPFKTIEEYNADLMRQARGLKEAFRQSEENLKTTTVEDVLEGWRREHQHYLDIEDRVLRLVQLSSMSEFFRHLISLGLPREELLALPAGKIVLETPTGKEILNRGMEQWEQEEARGFKA